MEFPGVHGDTFYAPDHQVAALEHLALTLGLSSQDLAGNVDGICFKLLGFIAAADNSPTDEEFWENYELTQLMTDAVARRVNAAGMRAQLCVWINYYGFENCRRFLLERHAPAGDVERLASPSTDQDAA